MAVSQPAAVALVCTAPAGIWNGLYSASNRSGSWFRWLAKHPHPAACSDAMSLWLPATAGHYTAVGACAAVITQLRFFPLNKRNAVFKIRINRHLWADFSQPCRPPRPAKGIALLLVCVALCAVFCLSVAWCFLRYVYFCLLCLIVVSLQPCKNQFAFNNNNKRFFVQRLKANF
jgi:hypothetical protein